MLNKNLLADVKSTSAFEEWKPTEVMPQILGIIITTLIIVITTCYFFYKVKKIKPNESLDGFALLIEIFINWVRSLVIDVMGIKFIKLTPYFIYLLSYIAVGNVISILGFESPVTSYTVPLSMAIITFVGIFVVGLKYQRWSFFEKYFIKVKIKNKRFFLFINPLEIVGQITPLISISFRLWGNISAGAIIMTIFYGFTAWLMGFIPVVGVFNFLGSALAPPLHAFFDLLSGVVQAIVFSMLTMVYWGTEAHEKEEEKIEAIQSASLQQVQKKEIIIATNK